MIMILNDDIVKIMEKLFKEKYLNDKVMFKAYYMFLKTNLSEEELGEYAKNNYDVTDVDEWIALKKIFGDISYNTAMIITNALYQDQNGYNVMDSNFDMEYPEIGEREEKEIDHEADWLWYLMNAK